MALATVQMSQAKKMFFDRAKMRRGLDRARIRYLSQAGAFVRRSARSLIRKRKKPSLPGSPPSSHAGTLRRFLVFALDSKKASALVGPVKTNQIFFDGDGQPVTGTVPRVLEYGGEIAILEVQKFGKWQRADLRSKRRLANLPTRKRTVRIQPRPFMQPALKANEKKFPGLWKGQFKKG